MLPAEVGRSGSRDERVIFRSAARARPDPGGGCRVFRARAAGKAPFFFFSAVLLTDGNPPGGRSSHASICSAGAASMSTSPIVSSLSSSPSRRVALRSASPKIAARSAEKASFASVMTVASGE